MVAQGPDRASFESILRMAGSISGDAECYIGRLLKARENQRVFDDFGEHRKLHQPFRLPLPLHLAEAVTCGGVIDRKGSSQSENGGAAGKVLRLP